MRQLILLAHNLRSAHNVGSLLRTADGLDLEAVYLTGYTPYPLTADDQRLPHLARKTDRQIAKTALGAEKFITWQQRTDVFGLIDELKEKGFSVIALEQAPSAVKLLEYSPPEKVAIIVGREVEGIETTLLEACNTIVEIPMLGKKESFNVVQAAAMALYQLRFQ